MKREQIHLWDIERILFGQAPPIYLLEVFIRTLIVFLAALVAIRLLGKRMSGQLTIVEMAVMITLGAIISVPMQLPDRGLLHGLLALCCAVAFQRGINLWGFYKSKVEKVTQGQISMLVKNGVLMLDEMNKTNISKQQIFAELRSKKIYNLGKVKRLYLEACGIFSIVEEEHEKPGLPVLPPNDQEVLSTQTTAPESKVVCINCGTVQTEQMVGSNCQHCGKEELIKAIV